MLYEIAVRYATWVLEHDGENVRDVYDHGPDEEIHECLVDACLLWPSDWLEDLECRITDYPTDEELQRMYGAVCAHV